MSCDVVMHARPHSAAPIFDDEHFHLDGLGAAAAARRYVRKRLAGYPEDLIEAAVLLTSELVTNGILHGRSDLTFGMCWTENEILVSVTDDNEQTPNRDVVQTPTDLLQNGRGMALVVSLADDFGWTRLPEHRGKVVWFTLLLEGGQRQHPIEFDDVDL